VILFALAFSAEASTDSKPDGGRPPVKLWLESSLQRIFPNSLAGERKTLTLLAARNQRLSFQACVRNLGTEALRVDCEVSGPSDFQLQVRRVGYVPMLHHTPGVAMSEQDGVGEIPGFVPDPLFPEKSTSVGPSENQSFWITVTVPTGSEPGLRKVLVRLAFETGREKQKVSLGEMTAEIDVRPLTLQARRNFPVTHWWQPDGLYDWYKVEPFGERWWQIAEVYVRNMVSHGSNTILVPVFHMRREVVTRPPQMLKVTMPQPGRYEFDFSDILRFVKMAQRCGMEYFEFPHLWLYWGVRNPIHVYRRDGERWSLFWPTETEATGETYRNFLKQFLPALHNFLTQERILERSFFHLSDEPHGDEHFNNYRKARALLKELAPWMKVMDALSEVRYGKVGLTDIPIPILNSAQGYIEAGIPHWVYYCTSPRGQYLNRFFDTPLAKIRMSGWLFYRLGARGFLHWGYSYWYKMETQQLVDPFLEGAGGDWPSIPYGDPFVVYPGEDGPIDSIRWEVFAESLQDYALLQAAGVRPTDPLLSALKSYSDFPKTEKWLHDTLEKILR
jgi:hypothetical protein